MIEGLGSVAVLVHDARKSAEWNRSKLGFEIIATEGHAVFVKPGNSPGSLIHLCERCEDWGSDRPGGRTGIWFRCGELTLRRDERSGRLIPASRPEDVESSYHQLKQIGVEFTVELTTTSWGKFAIFKDPDGNEFEMS